MKKIIGLLIFITIFTTQAFATEAYIYAQDTISTFNEIKVAADTGTTKKIEGMEVIHNLMQNSIMQKNAFQLASYRLKKYESSKDEQIKQSAVLIRTAIEMNKKLSELITADCEKILNNPKAVLANEGTAYKRIYELTAQSKNFWEAYATASSSLTHALVGNGKNISDMTAAELNTPNNRIKITAKERDLLKKQIIDSFGESIKKPENQSMSTLAVFYVYKFLNDKWITVDAK